MSMMLYMVGILACSLLTGLVTEAVKKLLKESKVSYKPNLLAAVVAVLIGAGVGVGYIVYAGLTWTPQIIILLILLIILSWLCAMVGYDKVVQSIEQIVKKK